MKKFMMFLALSSVSMLSADYYYDQGSSCPGGNCGYQQRPYTSYPEASGQEYYRNNPQYFRQASNPGNQNYNRGSNEQNQMYDTSGMQGNDSNMRMEQR